MQVLIKKAKIIHPTSPHHGEQVDILITDGIIESIGTHLEAKTPAAKTIEFENLCISPGLIDVGVQIGDPGFEHREDLRSAGKASIAGGYTALAVYPNTHPTIQSKSEVLYLKNNTQLQLVDFHPIGALSQNCEGKDLTELIDMHHAGAVAFSDGLKPAHDSGLMMRALQYVRAFDGIIFNHPHEKSIAFGGQVHEGLMSTSLGLAGISEMSEELMVQRDLFLANYTESRIHISNISTKGSVEMIRAAKEKGVKVTCSVPVMNLLFEDTILEDFDTNFKVLPPLRSSDDIAALLEGIKDGTIDFIASNHVPLEKEAKDLEFLYADFGAIGLETTFIALASHLKNELSLDTIVEKLAIRPREILDLDVPKIEERSNANLTLFQTDIKWQFSENDIHSKSKNSPFIGQTFDVRVLGGMNNDQLFLKN